MAAPFRTTALKLSLGLILSSMVSISPAADIPTFDCAVHDSLSLAPGRAGSGVPDSEPPFVLVVLNELADKRVTAYEPGKVYTVLLYGNGSSSTFGGLELQARASDGSGGRLGLQPVGRFLPDPATCAVLVADDLTYWENWRPASAFLPNKQGKLKTVKSGAVGWGFNFFGSTTAASTTTLAEVTTAAAQNEIDADIEKHSAGSGLKRLILPAENKQSLEETQETEVASTEIEIAVESAKTEEEFHLEVMELVEKQKEITWDEPPTPASTMIYPKKTNSERSPRLIDSYECGRTTCFNGGSCELVQLPRAAVMKSTHCQCVGNFSGPLCQSENPCASVNCGENGKCVAAADGKTSCQCSHGFAGRNCELPCPSYFCRNGGICDIDRFSRYVCRCPQGFSGAKCETNDNDCHPSPCKNGGTCLDKVSDFECVCPDGWMGKTCDRPCQNVYKLCDEWAKLHHCETMRNLTDFYVENCPASCGLCVFNEETVSAGHQLPAALHPYKWLIGEWRIDRSFERRHYPIDFPLKNAHLYNYVEALRISHLKTDIFGTPSLLVESVAKSVPNKEAESSLAAELLQSATEFRSSGVLSVKSLGGQMVAQLISTTDDGVTTVEQGLAGPNTLNLRAIYVGGPQNLTQLVPASMQRSLSLDEGAYYMRETCNRIDDGVYEYQIVKYFRRHNEE